MNRIRKSAELVGLIALILAAMLSNTIAADKEAKKSDSLYIGDQTDQDASDSTINVSEMLERKRESSLGSL